MEHVYVHQVFRSMDIQHLRANVNFRGSRVVTWGHNFEIALTPPTDSLDSTTATASDAVKAFAAYLNVTVGPAIASVPGVYPNSFTVTGSGLGTAPAIAVTLKAFAVHSSVIMAWNFNVKTSLGHWYDVHVNSVTGQVESVHDWSSVGNGTKTPPAHANHRAKSRKVKRQNPPSTSTSPVPFGSSFLVMDSEAEIRDPVLNGAPAASAIASPQGWTAGLETTGNNALVAVYTDPKDSTTGLAIKSVNPYFFIGAFDPTNTDLSASQQAAGDNLFYWVNMMHDLFYLYGFDEASGNFQLNNLGKDGVGGDAVQGYVQDNSGLNHAYFSTPPDGTPPSIHMFIWNSTTPNRDSDMDPSVIHHECGHGVSNRLTGGANYANCLVEKESNGMGEGWSDFWSVILRLQASDTRSTPIPIADWVSGKSGGVRQFPYSTDQTINPLTFLDYDASSDSHAVGTLWMTMLNDVLWNLIDKYGFAVDLFDPAQTSGNIVMIHLVINGFKLQPCNPTFLNARDAILAADAAVFKGLYRCEIWAGFAGRGLGVLAQNGFPDASLPADC